MIVIADTAPINYLILIGEEKLLRELYKEVIIPQAVQKELLDDRSPSAVKAWMQNPPEWVRIEAVESDVLHETAQFLDAGEREAIALARLMQADLLLIDEQLGRREAQRLNLAFTGTVGVLLVAAQKKLIDLPLTVARLQATSFFLSPQLLRELLLDRTK